MKGVIIGTAGHVDHGKTALIRALTGIETDRLREEKKRGITIDLGFAFMNLPTGERVGIIDVPGHEKFVGNMLAGAGGIDLALLVVAADDGVMPQTREHLGILSLLNIKDGAIVITKKDLAEPGWIELVREDIRTLTAGTFLEGAPIAAVSSHTGDGLPELKEIIRVKVEALAKKSDSLPFRIPVDRVFSVEGFGTVITGTMIEGSLPVGGDVEIYPSSIRTRVRNLQVHGEDVPVAFAGQRVAVNLSGVRREELTRGDVLAQPCSMENTMMLDVRLRALRESPRAVENGSRMHFFHGARELLCKVVLLDRDRLAPGEECYAQLRFTEPLAAKKDDRFVVRFYSPVETVGGGAVLDANPPKRSRRTEKAVASLRVREKGSDAERLHQAIHDASPALSELEGISRRLGLYKEAFLENLSALAADGRIALAGERRAVSADWLDTVTERMRELLGEYHKDNPLQAGMRRDELRGRLLPGRDSSAADQVLTLLEERGSLRVAEGRAFLPGFAPARNESVNRVEKCFQDAGYTPPGMEELTAAFPREKSLKKQVEALLASGALTAAAPGIWFHKDTMEDAVRRLTGFISDNGEITLAQFRDLSGTSRKFSLALLEYFDRHGVTKKIGDARVLARRQG
ncbi:MAG: selenocysteine-specific translation elongation factor [Oscillospiraceae bacterium]|jgi:selenocysteine-specific elongation factor|nr:selenocysteine-specific translation elongation factor [Oscillospiraceae bacterium]